MKTTSISTPDSEATVYLSIYPGSYQDWKPTCIWTSATEIVFPEDLSYLFAGINGTTYEPKFTFRDNKTKEMLNFSQVKNISHLFHNTRPWMGHDRSFNVSTFISCLKEVTNMTRMFYDSSYIERIYVSDTFVTTNVTASSGIFGGSFDNLRGQQGTSVPGHDISYARIDGGPSKPGAFWRKP